MPLGTASSALTSIVIPLAIVLVFTGLLLAVLSLVRRRMRIDAATPRDFTLTELRDLHRQGKMTDQEFERAKSLLVGKVHSNLAKEPKPGRTADPLGSEIKSELEARKRE